MYQDAASVDEQDRNVKECVDVVASAFSYAGPVGANPLVSCTATKDPEFDDKSV
jgi:hypothetical protein